MLKIYEKIEKFSDKELKIIWDCLTGYDPKDFYAPGITMDDWAQAVYSEMSKRGIPAK